jgi:hypothetical protein
MRELFSNPQTVQARKIFPRGRSSERCVAAERLPLSSCYRSRSLGGAL